jgi:hypothetical protein
VHFLPLCSAHAHSDIVFEWLHVFTDARKVLSLSGCKSDVWDCIIVGVISCIVTTPFLYTLWDSVTAPRSRICRAWKHVLLVPYLEFMQICVNQNLGTVSLERWYVLLDTCIEGIMHWHHVMLQTASHQHSPTQFRLYWWSRGGNIPWDLLLMDILLCRCLRQWLYQLSWPIKNYLSKLPAHL